MDEIGELYAVFDQMRLEIKQLAIQYIEQEQTQKKLISNISHEVRTPLTTIKAYLDAISEEFVEMKIPLWPIFKSCSLIRIRCRG